MNVKQFRDAVYKYVVLKSIKLTLKPNEPTKVRAKCKKDVCNWVLYTGVNSKSQNFIIKTYNHVHTCFRYNRTFHCNTNYIATKYRQRILSQPRINIRQLVDLVKEDLKIYVSLSVCRRAKIKVLSESRGDS